MNILLLVLVGVIGASLGSFLSVLVYRWKHDISLIERRSFCIECEESIPWYHNIPLVSFIVLQGRCSKCSSKISLRYFFIELWMTTAFVFVFWWGSYNLTIEVVRDWLLVFIFTFIFIYDLRYQLIPDRVTIPAIILLLAAYLFFGWNTPGDILIGILLGGGFFLAQFAISKGRWIGGGDIRLGVLMGVVLGWPEVVLSLFFAYIIGALVSIGLIIFKNKTFASKTPFGTYLVIGALVTHFFSKSILDLYFNLVLF